MIDLEHKNSLAVRDWFKTKSRQLAIDDRTVFEIYKDISYYGRITESASLSDRLDTYKKQSDFIKKNILGLMYEESSSARNIKQGYVYAVHNPSWNEYVKIGCTIDVYDRLNVYQSYSPLRDYEIMRLLDMFILKINLGLKRKFIRSLIGKENG